MQALRISKIGRSVGPGRALAAILVAIGVAAAIPSGFVSAGEAPESSDPGLVLDQARSGHTATVLDDLSVLIAGGFDETRVVGAAEIYLPHEVRFEPIGSLEQARAGHTATALSDGRVLVLGGWGQKPLSSAELYDRQAGSFTRAGRLKRARVSHTATLLDDGRVMVVGGLGVEQDGIPLASVELYDPAIERSSRLGRLETARFGHTATRLDDGRVLIVGGQGKNGRPVASAELVDPATGGLESIGAPAHRRARHTAIRLDDGRVLVIGGVSDTGPAKMAELYDPTSQSFTSVGMLAEARVGHSSTLLRDGRTLVIGGSTDGPASVEIADAKGGTFTPVGSLRSPRFGHQATLLADGTVLITGGMGAARPVRSAELFDPATMRVVAFGPVEQAAREPRPTPSLPPLGDIREGGRIMMTGSRFEMTFPADWTVELADPDPDVLSATPGEAWEALRATDAERGRACSVSIGVATTSLRERSGGASDEVTIEPRWHESEPGTLLVPDPRLTAEAGGVYGVMMPRERLHGRDPRLEHDVLYVVSCNVVSPDDSRAIERELDVLVDSFEFLPSAD